MLCLQETAQSYFSGSVLIDPPTISSAPSTDGAYALMFELSGVSANGTDLRL